MKFGYIDESRKSEWETLVAKNSFSGFMQTFWWAEFRRECGWETFKIGMFEDNILIGGAIVMKYYFGNTTFLYSPQGPVLPYDQDTNNKLFSLLVNEVDKLVTYWGRNPTTHFRIDPLLTQTPNYVQKFTKSTHNPEPKQTIMVDLTVSKEEMLARMKPKGRYNIKVAQKHGITVNAYATNEGLKTFHSLYHQTKERNEFGGKQDWYFEKLFPLLIKNNSGTIYIAYLQGKPLAASLTIFFGDKAIYFYGASANSDREKMAPYLLHWEIMQEAKTKGYAWYDLWGIAKNEEDENDSWHGFTKFKRQFGGTRFDFVGAYDLVYNKKLYEKYLKESEEI